MRILVTTIFFLGGIFCAANANAQTEPAANLPANNPETPVRIFMQWVPQAQFAGYIMAYEKGFFAKHNAGKVQISFPNLADSPLTQLDNGNCEYVTTWLTTAMHHRAAGSPIINVAQFHRRSASMLVANKAHGIEKPTDLNGKIILSWGGDFTFEVILFLQKYNITPQAILPLSTSLSPFLKGAAAATQAMEYNEYLQLLAFGAEESEMTVFRLEEHGICILGDGLYTTRERWRTQPAQVNAIRNAVAEGWEYAFRNPQETVDKVMEYIARSGGRSNAFHQQQMLATIEKLMEFDPTKDYRQFGKLRYPDFAHTKLLLQRYGDNVDAITYESFTTDGKPAD